MFSCMITSASVNPATGGTLSLADPEGHGIALSAPSSFASGSVEFQINQLDPSAVLAAEPLPKSYSMVGDYLYNIKAVADSLSSASMSQPIALTVRYSPSEVQFYGLASSSLALLHFNGTQWNVVSNCTNDLANDAVSCDVSDFSPFVLGAATATLSSSSSTNGGSSNGGSSSGGIVTGGGSGSGTVLYPSSSTTTATSSVVSVTRTVAVPGNATSTVAIESLLQSLLAKLHALVRDLDATVIPSFIRNLTIGSRGADVKNLQIFLNDNGDALAASGPGSPGDETQYFGPLTKDALARFQAANDIHPAYGFFGPITRGYIRTRGE